MAQELISVLCRAQQTEVPPSLQPRQAGNEYFKAGKYFLALAEYSKYLEDPSCVDRSIVLSNRALCKLKVRDFESAVTDSRDAVQLDPLNGKAQFRLAKALLDALNGGGNEAAMAVVIAVALLGSTDPQVKSVYNDIVTKSSEVVKPVPLDIPKDAARVALVKDAEELADKFEEADAFVLAPSSAAYFLDYRWTRVELKKVLIGLSGNSRIEKSPSHMHAVSLQQACSLTLVNLALRGSGDHACAAIGQEKAVLTMINCRVENYSDVACLCARGLIRAHGCIFKNTAKQAVEVREGGSFVGECLRIEACLQGVSVYGGAKEVSLTDCEIAFCVQEGMLVAGTFANAATIAGEILQGNTTSKAAEIWGRARGVQTTVCLEGTTIKNSGRFGASIDKGATVSIHRCHLVENDPVSLFVKGGSNLTLSSSEVTYTKQSSKCGWGGFAARRTSGIHIAVNYGGDVNLLSNVFIGPGSLADAIVEEYSMNLRVGLTDWWSKPSKQKDCLHFASRSGATPALATLALKPPGVGKTASVVDVKKLNETRAPLEAHLRPCYTLSESHWCPSGFQYYVIGNTFGCNVAAGADCEADEPIRVLLAAGGDIRNLLATVHASGSSTPIHFTLIDGNKSLLARNMVLLYLIAESGASDEDVLAVWANHLLSPRQRDIAVSKALKALIFQDSWPSWMTTTVSLADIFQAWAHASDKFSPGLMLERRHGILQGRTLENSKNLSLTAAGDKSLPPKMKDAILAYVTEGSLPPPRSEKNAAVNPTMLTAPELQYNVYPSCSIFRAVKVDTSAGSVKDGLLSELSPQFKSLRTAVKEKRFQVRIIAGDAIATVLDVFSPAGECFDFVDTSNLSDYVSLASVLYVASLILKRKPSSRLITESLRKEFSTADECLGAAIPRDFFETLTGLQLDSSWKSDYSRLLRLSWKLSACPILAPGRVLLDCLDLLTAASADKAKFDLTFVPLPSVGTLVGLILSFVPDSVRLLDFLAANKSGVHEHEWEIDVLRCRETELQLVAFNSQVGLRLAPLPDHPLFLVFSPSPLPTGSEVAVKEFQVMTSTAWDSEMGVASFVMPKALLAKASKSMVTLCCLTQTGTMVVGISAPVRKLQAVGVANPLLKRLRKVDGDEFLFLSQSLPQKSIMMHQWNPSGTAVDILLPAPVEAAAKFKLTETDETLQVKIGNETYSVPWPGRRPSSRKPSKLNRRLGLLSVVYDL